ncbi:hypothetical protein ABPG75_007174 [Micractinium tetrahymenae]
METVRRAALPNSAARPLQGAAACSRGSVQTQAAPTRAAAPHPCRRRHLPAVAAPPPPLAWPRSSSQSSGGAFQSRLACRASQGSPGGAPDAQQQPWQQQGQRQGQQQAGSGGAAGGWQGALHRSDSWVIRACRAVVGFFASAAAMIAADVRSLLSSLLATAHELPPLLAQLRYPSARLVAKRTAQVLAVVALLLAYVVAVDALCSQIPRGIQYTQAHPDWLRRTVGGLLAAARHRLPGGG